MAGRIYAYRVFRLYRFFNCNKINPSLFISLSILPVDDEINIFHSYLLTDSKGWHILNILINQQNHFRLALS